MVDKEVKLYGFEEELDKCLSVTTCISSVVGLHKFNILARVTKRIL